MNGQLRAMLFWFVENHTTRREFNMSKFTAGQTVRVTQVTDIDEPIDSPERVIKTDEELTEKGFIDGVKMIGQIARVIDPAINDYYDLLIEIDGETYAFMEADLEPVDATEHLR